jgi:ribosomal protein L37AE/L43A
MVERFCGQCKKKTEYTVTEEDNRLKWQCNTCHNHYFKQKPKEKMFVKQTEQYNVIPELIDEPRAGLVNGTGVKPYPSCKIHGAMLCYEHDVWRCVECGFAVIYER